VNGGGEEKRREGKRREEKRREEKRREEKKVFLSSPPPSPEDGSRASCRNVMILIF
jgi:hypothetical protein